MTAANDAPVSTSLLIAGEERPGGDGTFRSRVRPAGVLTWRGNCRRRTPASAEVALAGSGRLARNRRAWSSSVTVTSVTVPPVR